MKKARGDAGNMGIGVPRRGGTMVGWGQEGGRERLSWSRGG